MEEENNNTNNEEIDSETEQEQIICTNCNEKNPQTNLFCNYCGHHFVDKVKCNRCGEEVPVYNSYCSYCGAPMRLTQEVRQRGHQSITHSTTPQQSGDFISKPQFFPKPIHQLPPEVQERLREQERKRKLETRNTIGTVFGIISLVLGIGTLITFFLMLFLISGDFLGEIIGELNAEITTASYYGLIIGFFIPPIAIFLTSGISLLIYKIDGDAWRGLYRILRFMFLTFSALFAILTITSTLGWIFYNPNDIGLTNGLFWLFGAFLVPIGLTKLNLYLLLFFIYFGCILLMTIPTLVKYILERKREKNEISDEYEAVEIKESETQKLGPQQELRLMKINPIEAKKGIMPNIFYRIKNIELIKSLELLGATMLASIIIILILTPFIPPADTEPIAEDPFIAIAEVAWAGIFEEISFRLILIGVPMIFVVLIRYILQQKEKVELGSSPANKSKLKIYDIFLAIRGKYKTIGYPEWILVGISSLIFGFAHWEKWTGGWEAWKIVQATASGIFLSYAFVKYGIESAIFVHSTNNVISALSIYTMEVGNTNWLTFITNFMVWGLVFVGVMKAVSFIINLIFKRMVKLQTQTPSI